MIVLHCCRTLFYPSSLRVLPDLSDNSYSIVFHPGMMQYTWGVLPGLFCFSCQSSLLGAARLVRGEDGGRAGVAATILTLTSDEARSAEQAALTGKTKKPW